MKSCQRFQLFLLFFCFTTSGSLKSSDQSTRFWSTLSNYITSYQKYYIKNQNPIIKPIHDITVQLDTQLSQQEKIFIKNRSKIVQETLQNHFDIDTPLAIALCCSGGGNRSMIGSLGLLSGAAKTNLLDATMYLAGVSGSTWAILPYFYKSACEEKNNLQVSCELKEYFLNALLKGTRFCFDNYCTPSLLNFTQVDDFLENLIVRYGYDQNITLVDFFGPLIAHQCLDFLGEQKLKFTWSMFIDKALQGNTPLPLCAAAFKKQSKYEYFEMSPFQSGSKLLGYIPTQYLGSEFNNKKLNLNKICPEYSLGFYMGLYGSAFAQVVLDIHETQQSKHEKINPLFSIFEEADMKKYISYKNWNLFYTFSITNKIKKIAENILIQSDLDLLATFPNYNPEALQGNKTLGLFDAGIGCNFPISPLIDRPERAIDLIIMYDSHPGSSDLATVYDYAISCGISFDTRMKELSIEELTQNSMTIFNDPRSNDYNVTAATILYFPTRDIDISYPPYTTFNFKYEIDEFKKLNDCMEDALISNIENIKNVMKLIANKKIKENQN